MFDILLKYGPDLDLPVATHRFVEKSVFEIVAEVIGKLQSELALTGCRVLFRGAGFADDSSKANAFQVLKQFGIDDVKSL
ncbi:hypothetical protein [Glaciimonas immobilis]|uniref:Uncharacterized protein n=1 Tax=Glaciimonas immobilis TaxID=728004 RepID=A0A840RZB6_9BURK|nr:hypothetical protein [Glaciimonas immobilis]KAF3995988.1 hypothetical protein HAV38_21015 [Glaciimonas immobilis]MBB5202458.1 hypothetical protein [Glaciimonas immobilis]